MPNPIPGSTSTVRGVVVPAQRASDAGGDGPLGLLAAGIPLTLLLDLADPAGPDSQAICTSEGGDISWLLGRRAVG